MKYYYSSGNSRTMVAKKLIYLNLLILMLVWADGVTADSTLEDSDSHYSLAALESRENLQRSDKANRNSTASRAEVQRAKTKPQKTPKITIDNTTVLSPFGHQNTNFLALSRTGRLMAGYTNRFGQVVHYKTTDDGGLTWSKQMDLQENDPNTALDAPVFWGGVSNVGMSSGGVIHFQGGRGTPIEPKHPDWFGEKGWFSVPYFLFADDFLSWTDAKSLVYIPDAIRQERKGGGYIWFWSLFSGKIIQLQSGDLLAPMYGLFEADPTDKSRVIVVRSQDKGRTWRYQATVGRNPEDPNPELPGVWVGYCEPSIAQLADGRLLAIMRTGGADKPLYVCWSQDLGLTWSKPVPTTPKLYSIWPTLQVLDNGVVACIYGRPGVHIAFSTDCGQTWPYKLTLSELRTGITGMADMVKTGPNKLLAIAGIEGGTKAFSITVDLASEVSEKNAVDKK